uniref:(northern house mosquito) hypothetical protein n=1 Tax=Culex pipiens TaxID=7175 RepID=A0A8D8GCQ0_CULPI
MCSTHNIAAQKTRSLLPSCPPGPWPSLTPCYLTLEQIFELRILNSSSAREKRTVTVILEGNSCSVTLAVLSIPGRTLLFTFLIGMMSVLVDSAAAFTGITAFCARCCCCCCCWSCC